MTFRCLIPDRFIDVNAQTEKEAYDLARQELIRKLENDEIEIVVWELSTDEQRKLQNRKHTL